MGITYESKPDFIERLIEVGSQHFFLSFGNLSFAAAEAEIGEHIGVHSSALGYSEKSLWHLKKMLELYTGLANSLSDTPVSERAKKILASYDFNKLGTDIANRATVIHDNGQWQKFVTSSKKVDPLGTIKDFIAEADAIVPHLETLVDELDDGVMNPVTLHVCLTAFIRAMTFGQYIAEFNRDTKERFA